MHRYRFQFSTVSGQTGDTVESDHSSDDDAMCDAARTVAEMLKEQAQVGAGLSGFSLDLFRADGQAVGGIEVIVKGPSACL